MPKNKTANAPERRNSRCTEAAPKLKRAEGQPDKIGGYASVFYREGVPGTEYIMDFWGLTLIERIMPGAFDRAIAEDDVRCLMNHESDHLLGRTKSGTLRLTADEVGLLYECDPPTSPAGMNAVEAIRRGDMDGSSFAFTVDKEMVTDIEPGVIIREIFDTTLYDVGPVTFPAYEGATAGIRSAVTVEAEAWLEQHRPGLVAQRRKVQPPPPEVAWMTAAIAVAEAELEISDR